jgi:hypothetical protein
MGSLFFGMNQLRIILQKQEAKDISIFDYAVRVAYSVLLGLYSIAIGNIVFVVVNFGAAILSAGVATAALFMKRKKGTLETPKIGRSGAQTRRS